ncbi:acyl-CoA dehydrogenase family protein [Agromyces aerolatus]|uniref:acyl-CoA dehydrogenase family protein n=1 Tax=Agromyces sp. LY-1074 TaxID=3074080 RepID=UPI0028591BC3|nr:MULTISPECIES: acyl-CoA dehydrogenase family protein [unclassified Agromyces]MDR5701610.1 acyl-CoA dehydrogenase family protein [Agromyces sp. LY-1074]MDR5706140.1 acyl-CoA dehydrogenase family protein [Agromyces sp. LY-1358]
MTITQDEGVEATISGSALARAKAVAPIIVAEADAGEAATDVTAVAADALKAAGLFWMWVPEELGGLEADLVSGFEAIEEISRADGSTGWVLMATAIGTRNAAMYLEEEGRQALFGGPEKAILGGFGGPLGQAVEVEGGLRGRADRLPFGSGSTYITNIAAHMKIVDQQGEQRYLEDGTPFTRVVYIPRDRFEILGNWDVMGLVATGSYDYRVPEQFIPDAFVMKQRDARLGAANGSSGPHISRASLGVAGHGGVVLGIMKRALQEVARIASTKSREGVGGTLAESDVFRKEFASREASYQAARAYFLDTLAEIERSAATTNEVSSELGARIQQATTYIHEVADGVVGFAHLWAGSQALRNPSAIGRCTRDYQVAKNHLLINPLTMLRAVGPILDAYLED